MDRSREELEQELLDRIRHALMYESEAKKAMIAALNALAQLREGEQEEANEDG